MVQYVASNNSSFSTDLFWGQLMAEEFCFPRSLLDVTTSQSASGALSYSLTSQRGAVLCLHSRDALSIIWTQMNVTNDRYSARETSQTAGVSALSSAAVNHHPQVRPPAEELHLLEKEPWNSQTQETSVLRSVLHSTTIKGEICKK